MFLHKRKDSLLRSQASGGNLIGDVLGEICDLLIELHPRDAERQMASTGGQRLAEQVACGILNAAGIMWSRVQSWLPHEVWPVVPAMWCTQLMPR